MQNDDILIRDARLIAETDEAWLVEIDLEEHWLPKSQCEFDGENASIPLWLANKKDII
jgi:hypothetical protein